MVNGTVSVINGATNTVIATISVGFLPNKIAYNPQMNLLYATVPNSNITLVIDAATNTVISTISGFGNPIGVAVDPTLNP